MSSTYDLKPFLTFAHGETPFNGLGVAALPVTYTWKIPADAADLVGGFSGEDLHAENVNLRHLLARKWQTEPEAHGAIAKWVITSWGGIRGNSEKTLESYSNEPEALIKSGIKGIASWSKVLSVVAPDQYAIYDARVAVALNALQILGETKRGHAFPYLPGRNNVTGHTTAKPKRGFSTLQKYHPATLRAGTGVWRRVPVKEVYSTYLDVLSSIRRESKSAFSLLDLEMSLFSQAEALAIRTEPSLDRRRQP